MREYTDQKNSEYGHVLRSDFNLLVFIASLCYKKSDNNTDYLCKVTFHENFRKFQETLICEKLRVA